MITTKKNNTPVPATLDVEHVPRLVKRAYHRMDTLAQLLHGNAQPILIEKQRVLVLDACADLLSVRTPRERGHLPRVETQP